MTDTFTLYKLIVLYMLDQISFPLSNAQISDFILEKEYTDYFTLQSALSELTETGLLERETVRNISLYHLTGEGRKILSFFWKRISVEIRGEIDAYLKRQGCQLRNALSTPADYRVTTDGDYAVRCRVLERDSALIDLTLTVPVKEQAEAICDHWREKSQSIYAYMMKELL